MGNASGHQCKVKMRGGVKTVNGNTYDIRDFKIQRRDDNESVA